MGTTNKNATLSTGSAMLSAIVEAHNANNTKAIGLEDCDRTVTDQAFTQWCAYVERLRSASSKYASITMQKDAAKQTVTKVRGALFAAWKDVLTDAIGEKFSKRWFVREDDTAWLLRAVVRNCYTANGSAYAFRSQTEFRREVERLIGCRLASNAIIDDAKAEVIRKYESAKRTAEQAEQRLNKGDKNHLPLTKQLEEAEKALAERTQEWETTKAQLPGGMAKVLIDQFRASFLHTAEEHVDEIRDLITRTTKSRDNALTDVANMGKEYKSIMAEVAKIEA